MSVMRRSTKAIYFLTSALKLLRRTGGLCPSCGCSTSTPVDRKFAVTSLRRCQECRLLFRSPTTTEAENSRLYQTDYRQGGTTETPEDDELERLCANHFAGTSQDAATYLSVLSALGLTKGSRVLDFGCSWGYGSWQLQRAGYDVQGFEISRRRCDYARGKLGIDAVCDLDQVVGDFDCVFSAHVIEHVPRVKEFIDFSLERLRPGGLFVAFTPNGSEEFRKASPEVWHRLWGLVHPQLCDSEYCRAQLSHFPTLVMSSPYDLREVQAWDQKRWSAARLDGCELLIVFRKVDPSAPND